MASSLSEGDRDRILDYAQKAVSHAVRNRAADPTPPEDGCFAVPGAAFVTLRRRAGGDLRGCIGHLVAHRPLGETLASVALAAALEDPRFEPVAPEELEGLSVEVSVIGAFAPTSDPLRDLRIGVHGLRIRHGDRSGLLLPQVAGEHRLDATGFLDAVCRKAGLPAGIWRDAAARVDLFTAEVIGPG